jgi:hypothetical protein
MKSPVKYTPEEVKKILKTQGHLDIRTEPGMKVIFASPENGYPRDQENCRNLGMEIGHEFTVSDISVSQSSTHFKLMEFPRRSFNSVNFCNVPGQKFVPMEEWNSFYRSSFRIR